MSNHSPPVNPEPVSSRERSPSLSRRANNANNANNNANNANNNNSARRSTSPLANLARGFIAGLNHADNLLNGRNDSPHSRRSVDPPDVSEYNARNNISADSLSAILNRSSPRTRPTSFRGHPINTTPLQRPSPGRDNAFHPPPPRSNEAYSRPPRHDSSPQFYSEEANASSRRFNQYQERNNFEVPEHVSFHHDSPPFYGSYHGSPASPPVRSPPLSPSRLFSGSSSAAKHNCNPSVVLSKYHRGEQGSRDFNKNHETATKAPPSKYKFSLCPIDSLMDSKAGSSALASFTSSHRLCTTNATKHCHKYDMLKPIQIPTTFDINTGSMSSTTKNLFNYYESFDEDTLVEWQDFIEVHFGPEDQISCSWLSDWFMNALSDELHDEVLQEFHDLSESKQGVATLIKLAFDKIQSNSHEAKRALSSIITKFSIADIKNEDVKQATSWLKSVVKALAGTDDIPQRALGYILDGMAKSSSSEFNSLCTMIKLASARLPAKEVDSEKNILDALDELNKHYREQVHGQKWPKLSSSSPSSAFITSSSHPLPSVFITSPSRPPGSFQPADVAAFIAQYPDFVQALLSSLNNHSDRICYNCKKTGHIASNCPDSSRFNNSSRGRSRERSSRNKPSNSRSRGASNNSTRSNASQSNPKTIPIPPRRPSTPAPAKSVTYKNPQTYAAAVNDAAAAANYSPFQAFLLRGDNDDSSKE